jgi:diguanylate cyclase (GGDEF)-like protein
MLASFPHLTESKRLAALRSYEVLDTHGEPGFDNTVHLAARLIGTPIALVSFIDAERQWFKARFGVDAAETSRQHAFCAETIRNPSGPLVVPDATLDPRFACSPLVTGAPGIRFYAGVPLVNPQGAAVGALCVIDRVPREISDGSLETLVRLAEAVMTALELRRTTNQIRRLPMTDILTGLASRCALLCAVENAIAQHSRNGEGFALLQLDLDHFKHINQRHGHMAGDTVLRHVADILEQSVRVGDLAARFGGDAFAMLLTDGRTDAAGKCALIRARIEAGMLVRGRDLTASIGAVTIRPPPADIDAALAAVEAVLDEVQSSGRNRALHRLHG